MGSIENDEPQPTTSESRGQVTRNTTNNVPKDPFNLIYVLFYWLGMGSLLPWNFFISVNDFWMHKYRDLGNGTETSSSPSGKLSDLQLQWNSYLSIASMIPNVTFLLLNAAFGHHFKTQPRLLAAQSIIILTFIFTATTAVLDTDSWQKEYLYSTLFTVVVINIMVAIYQGGLSGIAAKFPHRYMGSVVQGQALGGIFAALTNVMMLAIGGDSQKSAFYCFLITILFLATSLVAFVAMTRTDFYKFYFEGHHHNESNNVENDQLIPDQANNLTTDNEEIVPKLPQKIYVLKIAAQIWIWILAVFLSFLVTLAVFPAITALARSVHYDSGNEWNTLYFVPVGCFLLFNVGDYVGRCLGSFLQWPGPTVFGSLFMLSLSILRFAFLPLFLFCNVSPLNRTNTAVYFHSDAVYLILMVLFSVSNGYIGSITMMFAPKTVPPYAQSTAGSIMVSFLVLGLAVGAGLSSLSVLLL